MFGVDDPEREQIVAAVIVAAPDVVLDVDGLPAVLKTKLSAYKVPRAIVRLAPDELPVLSSGKPDMARLREMIHAR